MGGDDTATPVSPGRRCPVVDIREEICLRVHMAMRLRITYAARLSPDDARQARGGCVSAEARRYQMLVRRRLE